MMATIESERHLVEVSGKMLRANIVPSAHDPALEERERGFYRVSVNQAGDVFLFMLNGLVLAALVLVERKGVDGGFVCDNDADIFTDILVNDCADSLGLCIARVDESQFTVALSNSDDNILLMAWPTFSGFAANIRFVNFDSSVKHGLCFLHRGADSMAEVPCSFVRADTERALNLARGHSFFRFTEKERSSKPLFERQVRVIKNGSRRHGELVVALLTIEKMLLGFELHDGHLATQAARPFGEAQTGQQFSAFGVSREHRINVN